MSVQQTEHSTRSSFVKHSVTYAVGTVSVQAVGVLLIPMYTRYLSPAEYGVLQLLYRVGEILNICLMANGIQQATLNLYGLAPDEDRRKPIAATVAVVMFSALLLGAALLIGLSSPLSRALQVQDKTLLVSGIFALVLQGTTVMPLALMQARLESRTYVVTMVGMSVAQVAIAVVTIVAFGWGVWGAIASLAISFGTTGVVLTLRELHRASFRPDPRLLRQVLRFAAPFVPTGLFFFIFRSGDQFFLMRYWGATVLGVYALGYKIASAVAQFAVAPFLQVWSAWIYQAYRHSDSSKVLGIAITRILGAYMFVGLGLVVFQDEALLVLGSRSYAGATRVIAMIVVANFFSTWMGLMDVAFYVRGRTSLKPWIAAATALVTVILLAILVPSYADLGAASATALGQVFGLGLTFVIAQRVFPVKLEARRILAGGGLATILALTSRSLDLGLVSFALKIALCLLWPLTLWLTGVIRKEEKDMLRSYWQTAGAALRRITRTTDRVR